MSRELDVTIGAVNCQKRFGLATAWLSFGMVSPAYQGKGLGSALVLARLSERVRAVGRASGSLAIPR